MMSLRFLAPGWPRASGGLARRAAGRLGLAPLLALTLLAANAPPVHTHEDGTPGLYDEECQLARLAVPPRGLPPSAIDTAPVLLTTPDERPSAEPGPLPAAFPAAFGPRAPPALR
jgi:hypothetical protein